MRRQLLAFCFAVSLGTPLRAEGWLPPTADTVSAMRGVRPGGAGEFVPKPGDHSSSCGLGCQMTNWLQYTAVKSAAEMKPVNHEELRAAFLCASGIQTVQELFEDAVRENIPVRLTVPVPGVAGEIAEGPQIRSAVLIPETGGEAILSNGGGIVFHRMPDITRPLMRLMATYVYNADQLSELYREWKPEMKILDEMRSRSLLKIFLETMAYRQAKGVSSAVRMMLLQRTVLTVIENGADSYILNEYERVKAISGLKWSGRHIGRWHIHTPQFLPAGWHEGPIPNAETKDAGLVPTSIDLDPAIEGRSLTIIFFPDGFDVYDLFRGKKNQYFDKVVSYRSAVWKSHFRGVHARLKAQLGL